MGNSTVTTAVSQTDRPLHAMPAAHGIGCTRSSHQQVPAILADGLVDLTGMIPTGVFVAVQLGDS